MEEKGQYQRCRVAIVGAQRARVAKVVSLLADNEGATSMPVPAESSRTEQMSPTTADHVADPSASSSQSVVSVEYLPCVATFHSYEHDDTGETVRYLASVTYHGHDGRQMRGSSLAPFFDATEDDDDEMAALFPGISAIAIGCGIESVQDVLSIETFVQSLQSAADETNKSRPVPVECIAPNAEYSSMQEENEVYRALDVDAKQEAIRLQTLGPGKMAKFAASLAEKVIKSACADDKDRDDATANDATTGLQDTTTPDQMVSEVKGDEEENESSQPESSQQEQVSNDEAPASVREIDPTKTQFACRKCRTILFGTDDLEDPPHVPSQHHFSHRKLQHGNVANRACQSLFLSAGSIEHCAFGDMSDVEGKLSCPKCDTKLGNWKWAGAQCSCGTWVTPAIQIISSKVDVIAPYRDGPPPGTIVHPSMATSSIVNSLKT